MITETDALNTIEFEDYFVILPSTPLWDFESFRKKSNKTEGKFCSKGFYYNSGTNNDFLNTDQIKMLIEKELS